ncbi:MAG TPA: sensor histidine kinase [Micromonosporaceae bacterium]|nr:sensor histidine kinase [Micromonosporaceae bacterium]
MTTLVPGPDGARRAFQHQALLYGSDDEFASALVPFVQEGLRSGDHVVAVTTPAHIGLLRAELRADAADVRFIDACTWFQAPVGALAEYDRYLAEHAINGRVRLIGEAVWPESSPLSGEWPRYEAVMNVAFAAAAAWIVCPYDTRVAPPDLVSDARRTHPELALGAAQERSSDYLAPLDFHRRADVLELSPAPATAGWTDFGRDELRAVRGRVAAEAEAAGLRAERVAHLVCAVNEVATNAVQHGGGAGALRTWFEEPDPEHGARRGGLVCEVASHGEFTTQFPGYLPPSRDTTSGRGLWLVRQLCDRVDIRSYAGRSVVRMTVLV